MILSSPITPQCPTADRMVLRGFEVFKKMNLNIPLFKDWKNKNLKVNRNLDIFEIANLIVRVFILQAQFYFQQITIR